jgi:hypothetical protein
LQPCISRTSHQSLAQLMTFGLAQTVPMENATSNMPDEELFNVGEL